VTEKQAHVHVSGHPGRPELKSMYEWMRPKALIPVHGEMRHLKEQARFGLSNGIPRALVQTDGDIVRLAPNGPEKIGNAPVGRLVLDGDVILPSNGNTINERRRIAVNGQISVGIAVDRNGRAGGVPDVRVQGVPVEEEREAFLEDAVAAVSEAMRGSPRDREKLREQVRLAVRRVATRWTGKKPVIDVVVVQV
jgi:ribonuclease J